MRRSAEISEHGESHAAREECFQNPCGKDGLHDERCADHQRERAGHPLREPSRRERDLDPRQTARQGNQQVVDSVEEILRRSQRAPPQQR
jgi:hypothetical protein